MHKRYNKKSIPIHGWIKYLIRGFTQVAMSESYNNDYILRAILVFLR